MDTTTTIITLIACITFIGAIGTISAEGNMNTWETLWHIINKRIERQAEIKLEIEKERTKQLIEDNKARSIEFANHQKDIISNNNTDPVDYEKHT